MTPEQLAKRVNDATTQAREYANTDASRAVVQLLDALAECYRHDLVNVRPEDLVACQARTRQIISLRAVLVGEPHADPRI